MKHLTLLAILLAAPTFADEVPAPAVPVMGVVFVFTDCGKPVAFELIENDKWHIKLAGNAMFPALIAQARKAEAAGDNINFIELRAPGTCKGANPKLDSPLPALPSVTI